MKRLRKIPNHRSFADNLPLLAMSDISSDFALQVLDAWRAKKTDESNTSPLSDTESITIDLLTRLAGAPEARKELIELSLAYDKNKASDISESLKNTLKHVYDDRVARDESFAAPSPKGGLFLDCDHLLEQPATTIKAVFQKIAVEKDGHYEQLARSAADLRDFFLKEEVTKKEASPDTSGEVDKGIYHTLLVLEMLVQAHQRYGTPAMEAILQACGSYHHSESLSSARQTFEKTLLTSHEFVGLAASASDAIEKKLQQRELSKEKQPVATRRQFGKMLLSTFPVALFGGLTLSTATSKESSSSLVQFSRYFLSAMAFGATAHFSSEMIDEIISLGHVRETSAREQLDALQKAMPLLDTLADVTQQALGRHVASVRNAQASSRA